MKEPSRRLIVNADDFGLHESINEAVERSHQQGIVTSASLVVTGVAAAGAVEIAKRNPGLGVGIHLTLNGEEPAAPRRAVASLLDGSGRLSEDHAQLCLNLLRGRVRPEHVRNECDAQITRFLEMGLTPTHADSHRHLHLFPPIYRIVAPVLEARGIRRIRWLAPARSEYARMGMRHWLVTLMARYAARWRPDGSRSPDRFAGFAGSGQIDATYVRDALDRLTPGVTELSVHPGCDDAAIGARYGFWKSRHGWGCRWEQEFAAVMDTDIRSLVADKRIGLVNYAAL